MKWYVFALSVTTGFCIARWIVMEVRNRYLEEEHKLLLDLEVTYRRMMDRYYRVVNSVLQKTTDPVEKNRLYEIIVEAEHEPTSSGFLWNHIPSPIEFKYSEFLHENPNVSDKL